MPMPPCQWPLPCQGADAVVGVTAATPITAEAPRARASLRNMVVLLSQGRARNVHPGRRSLAPLERFEPTRPLETASPFATPNALYARIACFCLSNCVRKGETGRQARGVRRMRILSVRLEPQRPLKQPI